MRKISFNDKLGLTKAVLDGHKTMFRKVIKPQPVLDECKGMIWKGGCFGIGMNNPRDTYRNFVCASPIKVGEVLAIAQSYKDLGFDFIPSPPWYINAVLWTEKMYGFKNKMCVRADVMKHHIRITDIKVERLQDISDEDCMKEGIIKGQVGSEDTHFMDAYYCPGMMLEPACTPQGAFALMCDKTMEKDMWLFKKDAFVWVYEFKLID